MQAHFGALNSLILGLVSDRKLNVLKASVDFTGLWIQTYSCFFYLSKYMGVDGVVESAFVSESVIFGQTPTQEEGKGARFRFNVQAAFFRRLWALASFFCSKAPTFWMFRATTARATYRLKPSMP